MEGAKAPLAISPRVNTVLRPRAGLEGHRKDPHTTGHCGRGMLSDAERP